jgi:hypothetical protein
VFEAIKIVKIMTSKILSLLSMRLYQWRTGRSVLLKVETGDGSEPHLQTESEILNFKYSVEINAPFQEFLQMRNTCVLRHFI